MAHPFSTFDTLTRLEGVLRQLAGFVEGMTADAHLPAELRTLSLEVGTAKREVIGPLMVEAMHRQGMADARRRIEAEA